jgi:hemerythrin
MFEWQQEFSVGISSIDGQHRNLFRIAGELYSAMGAGQGRLAIRRILDQLVQYTSVHFANEERLMQQHGYPGYAAHKAEHDALTRKVLDFQSDYEKGRILMTVELLQLLKAWLVHHIQESDAAYGPYLRAKAVA